MKKVRESNFEIMRIISMFFIVVYHFLISTGGSVLPHTSGNTHLFLYIIFFIIIVHVNSFILLTGYFQYNQQFKLKKLISLLVMVYFYKVVIFCFFYFLGIHNYTHFEIIKILSPIELGNYWFFKVYILLYILSPYINIISKKLDERNFKKLLIILFILLSIISAITNQRTVNNTGFSITHFIYLYLIGAYLSKYPILKRKCLKDVSKDKILVVLLLLFIGIAIFRFTLYELCINCSKYYDSGIKEELLKIVTGNVLYYQPPLLVIQSIVYFLIFTTFTFKSKIINLFSSTIFSVYLITENESIISELYKFLGFNQSSYASSVIVKIIFYSIVIIAISTIVELVRRNLFILIRNIYQTLKNNYFKSLDNSK